MCVYMCVFTVWYVIWENISNRNPCLPQLKSLGRARISSKLLPWNSIPCEWYIIYNIRPYEKAKSEKKAKMWDRGTPFCSNTRFHALFNKQGTMTLLRTHGRCRSRKISLGLLLIEIKKRKNLFWYSITNIGATTEEELLCSELVESA